MLANGESLDALIGPASIILPQGARGPAFMVFDNFDVILQWNRSVSYALSVALLAEQISGGKSLPVSVPDTEAIGHTQFKSLQQQLTELGFNLGVVDGVPGIKTESAIRRYQSAQGLPADGYASLTLLRHLEQTHAAAAKAGTLKPQSTTPTFSESVP